MSDIEKMYLTISDILEYEFCPRFIYFMYCLSIPQYEGRKFKVLRGREIHELKYSENQNYLRKKLGVLKRHREITLFSSKFRIKGVIDDVFELDDGTMAPFEYKYSEYKGVIPDTYKIQLMFHALLVREVFQKDVLRGYICFTRSMNHIEEIELSNDYYSTIESIISDIYNIISTGYYPKRTKYYSKCLDCTYRNICI